MKTSADGLHTLELREGKRTHAYKDSKGVWTIGIGHTAAAGDPKPYLGLVITDQDVTALFANDIVKYENDVNEVFPQGMPQNAFDGAVSFHFNTGAIKSASWPALYKAGKFTEAKQHFLQWDKPPEIIPRRESEAKQIFSSDQAIPSQLPPQNPQQSQNSQPATTPSTQIPKTQPWYITFLKLLFLGHR